MDYYCYAVVCFSIITLRLSYYGDKLSQKRGHGGGGGGGE